MTFGSLFAGIGGLDLGLERAGMICKFQVENDPYAIKVLETHWPGVPRFGDIRNVKGCDLPAVDLLCGGFPCQDLSQAGKRAGIEGARSGLWFEFARLIGELRPRYVLIENVPGLLVYGAMRRVIGELSRLGYVGCWRCLRASEFGASHLRKRVFIVAYTEYPRSPHTGSEIGCGGHLADSDERRRAELAQSDIGTMAGCDGHGNGRAELENPARDEQSGFPGESRGMWGRGVCQSGEQVADSTGTRFQERGIEPGLRELPPFKRNGIDELADSASLGRKDGEGRKARPGQQSVAEDGGIVGNFAPGPSDPRWPAILNDCPWLAPALESPVRGMADGVSDWLDRAMHDRTKRLGRLGNAVVPQVAEWIGRKIISFDSAALPASAG